MKKKKVTYKEIMDRLDIVMVKTLEIERAVNYSHTLLLKYIEYNKDAKKLAKYFEKELKNDKQTPTNSTGASGNSK